MNERLQSVKLSALATLARLREEAGSSLVEFALVFIVIMTFLFGIMDFARFLYTYHFVSEVSREATRYAIVRGATFKGAACSQSPYIIYQCDATQTDIQAYVQGYTPPGISASKVTATATWPGVTPDGTAAACTSPNSANSRGCYVQVQVSYPFQFMLPFLPKSTTTYTLTSTSKMAVAE